ncbi:MAG: BACON domain-containing protein, partial [Ktedonobacteraceae bacterium]
VAQATNVLTVAAPVRRQMPTRVRRALLVFCVVGALALTIDSILLALSIMRHQAVARSTLSTATTLVTDPTPGLSATPGSTQPTFALSVTRLVFSATQGQADPQSQTVKLLDGQPQPFSWDLVPVSASSPWLHLSATQGHAAAGASTQVAVSALATQLAPGTYTTSLLAKAFDTQGKPLPDSPQTLTILLTVQAPCSLNVVPGKISFAAVLLSPPAPQNLSITENGNCARPLNWRASADVPWITFSSSSGVDPGTGSTVTIQASSSGKLIGTYSAHITLLATDAHGVPLTGTPVTITATLTVIA